ncbi:MAG: LysM peptidoglycan-binding domain-containing protein [Bacillota bacterium]|jgi:LysM repeat protein
MPVVPQCPGGSLYTVARGDTLFRLAQKFGVTERALRAANPQIANPSRLVVGQQICIPQRAAAGQGPAVPPSAAPPCPKGTIHVIRAGETLSTIATRHNIALSELLRANPGLTEKSILRVGQRICVPMATPPCKGGRLVPVSPGDTLASIGKRYGVTVKQLIDANPQIINPDNLVVGQNICVRRVRPRSEASTRQVL